MRKNIELKKEWKNKVRFCEDYNIEIYMMYADEELSLNVALDLNGETSYDNECIMTLDNIDEPTPEMLKKFKTIVKYFSQHFDNVHSNEKAIRV